jgi:hypothetical protein
MKSPAFAVMPCKYLFIGSGPATLAAVLSLPHKERRQSVVLEGANDRIKICPQLKAKSCSSCDGDLCPVINNVGGASAAYGNKLCHFPASDGVLSASPTGQNLALSDDLLDNLLARSMEQCANVVDFNPRTLPGIRKHYYAERLLLEQYKGIIKRIVERANSYVPIRSGHIVKDIQKLSDGRFLVSGDFPGIYLADNVVVGVGRAGYGFVQPWFDSLGIHYSALAQDVGYRFEFDSRIANQRFFYQQDPKYKFSYANLGSARTFCSCQEGVIIPVKFGSSFFADGAFLKAGSNRTNFALMARAKQALDAAKLEEWCKSVNIRHGNSLRIGKVQIGSKTPEELTNEICSLLPEGPSDEYTQLITRASFDIFALPDNPIASLAMRPSDAAKDLVIYGPAIDRYWLKPELGMGFQASVPGVYIIGDASGLSRGIVQAMISGIAWAQFVRGNAVDHSALFNDSLKFSPLRV